MNKEKYDKVFYEHRKIKNLKELIISSTEIYKNKVAYKVKNRPGGEFVDITYGKVREDIDALGTGLIDLGLKDKRIALVGDNSYTWLLTYFATVCGVGEIVPLDKNLPGDEIVDLIKRSGAKAVVFTKSSEKSLSCINDENMSKLLYISMGKENDEGNILSFNKIIQRGKQLIHEGSREFTEAKVNSKQMATLMFTSGTTGMSKGVMMSHENISQNVYNMSKLVSPRENTVSLSVLPMHHAYEMTCDIMTCFYQGLTVAICEGIRYIQKNMVEVHANLMLGVPLVFEKMYKNIWKQAEKLGNDEKLRKGIELSKKMKLYNKPAVTKKMFKSVHDAFGSEMEMFISGGAAIDPKVIEDFQAMGIPMIQGYGMSENAPIIAVNKDRYSKAASVGKPMPGTEVRIVNKDESGIGEIICKGPSVMMGYFENETATEEVLKNDWLYTGDYGYLDRNGFLYVSGRKKNVIVTKGGKNIFPEEIEYHLLQNEYIKEAMVYGAEDGGAGNTVIGVSIYPDYDLIKGTKGDLSEKEIYNFIVSVVDGVNSKIAQYQRIKRIAVRKTDFEKTTTGKIKRFSTKVEKTNVDVNPTNNFSEIKKEEILRAEERVKYIQDIKDPFVKHKGCRPITDIKQMFESSVSLYGDNVAFRQKFQRNEPYTTITYKEALSDVQGLGTGLLDLGLKGKRVGIIGETCYQWEISYLAAIGGIGVVVPLDKELNQESLEYILVQTDVEAVILDNHFIEMFKTIRTKDSNKLKHLIAFNESDDDEILNLRTLIDQGKGLIKAGNRDYIDAEIIADELAVILYTSGTTGSAKGVMLTNDNLVYDLMMAPTILNVNTSDIFFSVLPVHHTYECTCAFLLPLYKGASIAFCEGLKYIVKDLEEVRPTMLLGVPVLIESLYKKIWKNIRKKGKEKQIKALLGINRQTKKLKLDISKPFVKEILDVFGGRMRVIISGGAAIDPEILKFFNDLGIISIQGYGLTECSPMAALNPDEPKLMRNSSVGKLLPGTKVKIINKDVDGIGEICLKGANVMMGYYKNQDATDEVLINGWLHTGDLGYVDKQDFIYITGRQKNVIITKNGKNIFPEELEYYLGKVPFIDESLVWGEASEQGTNDTSIVATVILSEDEVKEVLGKHYDEQEAMNFIWGEVDKINETLPAYKKIKKIRIRKEAFDKTTAKKIKRFVENNK